jgi:low affinity Fe/Cu permease
MPQPTRPTMNERSFFDRFAEAATQFVSQGVFFAVSLVVVLVWLPSLAFFESVDTWQLVINTATSVLAFLLVALLQNSEQRNDLALHRKLDELAAGLADLMENELDGNREELGKRIERLRGAIRLEQEL